MATIALQLPGGGPAIHACIKAALERCGHEVAVVNPKPDLRIGIWGYDTDGTPNKLSGPPLVRWWIGTDLEFLKQGATMPHLRDARHNWAGSAELRGKLAFHGIDAEVLPIVPVWEPRQEPMPEVPVVMCYCPLGREEVYRWAELRRVMRTMPGTTFRVYRRSGQPRLANVEFVGDLPHDEMEGQYCKATAVLRLMERDGLSLSVLEALSLGRHVVWSEPYPGCRRAAGATEAVYALYEIVKNPGINNHEGIKVTRLLRAAADARLAQHIEEVLE